MITLTLEMSVTQRNSCFLCCSTLQLCSLTDGRPVDDAPPFTYSVYSGKIPICFYFQIYVHLVHPDRIKVKLPLSSFFHLVLLPLRCHDLILGHISIHNSFSASLICLCCLPPRVCSLFSLPHSHSLSQLPSLHVSPSFLD